MAQIILVTSFKGGVGKTTISANLAVCLAKSGRRVLACDCDLESRCLDIVLDVGNLPLFNICDVVSGKCEAKSATAEVERIPNLFFMPAPSFYPEAVQTVDTSDIFTEQAVRSFITNVGTEYDYIIFDLPARPDMLYRRLVRHADKVFVVSLHTATSIRAAEKTAIAISELCSDNAVPDTRLIVNGFRAFDVKKGENVGLYGIISQTKLSLAGVIPYDTEMVKAQEQGISTDTHKNGKLPFWKAICNIARRMEGIDVGLLEGIKTGVKKSDLY